LFDSLSSVVLHVTLIVLHASFASFASRVLVHSHTGLIHDTTTPGLKKRTTFTTCYNFYIHSSIATIFGTNVAKKVGNQNVLYFPTSPNWCFCTTWGNRKPGSCVFYL